jgi:hypothetical protein
VNGPILPAEVIVSTDGAAPGVKEDVIPAVPVSAQSSTDAAGRVVRIMMLGFAGSGKTTFLAGMWQYFSFGARDGVIFKTDDASEKILNGHCDRIQMGTVPPPTPNTKEWNFTVRAKGLSGNFTDAFTLTYVDYDGHQLDLFFESLDGGSVTADPPDSRVRQAMDQYDVIMGVLDGAKIAGIMHNRPDPEYRMWLQRLFRFIARQSDKTVHLVLTKHDLLKDFSLGKIIEELRSGYPPFNQFCDFPGTGKRRLIAVAALGTNDFARQASDGDMELDPAVGWECESVERPLVCTLPDVLDGALEKLRKAAPGYRPSPQSSGLSWNNYAPALYWAASLFVVDAQNILKAGPIDLSMSATVAALAHLAKLLAQQESGAPGSRFSLRRPTPTAATTEAAKALEHIISSWSARAKEFAKDDKHMAVLGPRET